MKEKPKIIVIVGPTASGKTSLSIELAKAFNGEIISADSRQVYRGLDLGTGKVTKEEMEDVPHHLLDVAGPQDTYTVADFVRDGRLAISDIISRGKLPIIVGGTFLYVDTLLGKMSTPDVSPNPELRRELEKLTESELFKRVQKMDPTRATEIDPHNKRRLIRTLEIIDAIGKVPQRPKIEPYNALVLGISIDKETLHKNIHTRLVERIDAGMIEEVKSLHANSLSYERLEDLGLEYRYIAQYLQGLITKETMLEELETKIKQYAKRQMTWLKRDGGIVWVEKEDVHGVEEKVKDFLSR